MLDSLKPNAWTKQWWVYPTVCLGGLGLGFWVLKAPNGGAAILAGLVAALICLVLIVRSPQDQKFLVRVFLAGLCLRWILGAVIHNVPGLSFLGADADTYNWFSWHLWRSWEGLEDPNNPFLLKITNTSHSGWGMFYYVAAIYYLLGQNTLAVQFITASLGASSAIVIYHIVIALLNQPRVARTAALLMAFSPSMILWSSQALKDAPIVFCLSICTLCTLKLRERLSLKYLILLFTFLFCLYSLRHYAFFVLFISIAGGMVMGMKRFSPTRIVQSGVLIIGIGFAFVYFGARDVAEKNFDLKRIQSGRVWSAQTAKSGYGGDVDITDTKAALSFLPIGVAYVLLAPFPWMINSLGQLITLPELILWWLSLPLLIKGYWFALRHRLKESFTLCLFTLGLTLVYALYQTNVGTAYRHRAQMYVFFVIFISIGWELRRNTKLIRRAEKARWYEQIRNRYTVDAPATH